MSCQEHSRHIDHIAEMKETVRELDSHLAQARSMLADLDRRLRPDPANEMTAGFPGDGSAEKNAA